MNYTKAIITFDPLILFFIIISLSSTLTYTKFITDINLFMHTLQPEQILGQ